MLSATVFLMRTIHLLPSDIIAKIAAGEVIERPAYAVKELIENSLDAGATNITIHLEESGLKKIVVHDNGKGMSKEDLAESFKLHTTSKIDETHSLLGIASLGFRGEALASIASMSDMVLQSRTQEDAIGTAITLKAGTVIHESAIGMPIGTSITIQNLFYAAPGRKKFLKSNRTELRHILENILYQAIAHPTVAFTLTHNGKSLLALPVMKKYQERLSLLFSKKLRNTFISLEKNDAYFSVLGFITQPQRSLTTSNKQYIFINNRHVADTHINQVVKQAYGSALPHQRFPGFILFIDLPFELVDVNVHPRKEQVSIRNKEQLAFFLQQTIQDVLETYLPSISQSSGLFTDYEDDITHSFAGKILREDVSPWLVRDSEQEKLLFEPIQLQNMYIVIPNTAGFMLIDQHAAHERILYEQYRLSFTKSIQKKNNFILPKPLLLDLNLQEKMLLEDNEQLYTSLGFVFKKKKNNCYVLTVPEMFQDRNIEELIKEILENISSSSVQIDSRSGVDFRFSHKKNHLPIPPHSNKKNVILNAQSEQIIKYLACRQAVKAGDSLNMNEMKRLFEQLEETKNNLTCPHGRPTRIQVTLDELHKVFKRK